MKKIKNKIEMHAKATGKKTSMSKNSPKEKIEYVKASDAHHKFQET